MVLQFWCACLISTSSVRQMLKVVSLKCWAEVPVHTLQAGSSGVLSNCMHIVHSHHTCCNVQHPYSFAVVPMCVCCPLKLTVFTLTAECLF